MGVIVMNYTIASGDNLWNIVKNNYDCTSDKEIMNVVKEIAHENDIKDINLIHAGANINLPETDKFIHSKPLDDTVEEETRADKFDEWTNSEENYEAAINGEKVDEFKMFDINLATYSSDLKDFSQEYINKYDEDGDGAWNIDEFTNMATAGAGIDEENKEEYEVLYNQLFTNLNIDDNKDVINAAEFASFLYTADVDWDNFNKTNGDVASSIDGKLDYLNYQTFSSLEKGTKLFEDHQYQKEEFFTNFYAA